MGLLDNLIGGSGGGIGNVGSETQQDQYNIQETISQTPTLQGSVGDGDLTQKALTLNTKGGNVTITDEETVARAFEMSMFNFNRALDSADNAYIESISAVSNFGEESLDFAGDAMDLTIETIKDVTSNSLNTVATAFQTATGKTEPISPNVLMLSVGGLIGLYFIITGYKK